MRIVEYGNAIQYDGTNATEVLNTLGASATVALVSENVGVLTLTYNGNTYAIQTGDWLHYTPGNYFLHQMLPAEFEAKYMPFPE